MSLLVIAPHADDEVLGCGGLIAKTTAAGETVDVILATQGDPSMLDLEEIEILERESKVAHDILGVRSTIRLGFLAPKTDTFPQHQLIDAISQVIQDVKPRTVLMPHPSDPHVDHRCVAEAALVATRPHPGQLVRTVLSYEVPSETEWSIPEPSHWFVPNVYVDIAEHLDTKVAALEAYQSQIREFPHPRSVEYLRALSVVRGAAVGFRAAEAFRLIRDLERF